MLIEAVAEPTPSVHFPGAIGRSKSGDLHIGVRWHPRTSSSAVHRGLRFRQRLRSRRIATVASIDRGRLKSGRVVSFQWLSSCRMVSSIHLPLRLKPNQERSFRIGTRTRAPASIVSFTDRNIPAAFLSWAEWSGTCDSLNTITRSNQGSRSTLAVPLQQARDRQTVHPAGPLITVRRLDDR